MTERDVTTVRGLLSKGDLETVGRYPMRLHPHPSINVLFREPRQPIDRLYDDAVQTAFMNGHGEWARRLGLRIKSPVYDDAASALAELRAYGTMRDVGIEVSPILSDPSHRTPDFEVTFATGRVSVEIASKLQGDDQNELQKQVEAGNTPSGVMRRSRVVSGSKIQATVVPIEPGGKNRVGLINRISRIKKVDTQGVACLPFILWIDFCNFGPVPDFCMSPNEASTIFSTAGRLNSGALWHAFYGWAGAPIFDAQLRDMYDLAGHTQKRCGRFSLGTMSKFSAVVLALTK